MSESSLSLNYWDIVKRVSDFLGYGLFEHGAFQENEWLRVKRVVEDGYRRFLFAQAMGRTKPHGWSFLRPSDTLSVSADDYDIDLPDAFGGLIKTFQYAAGEGLSKLVQVSVEDILEMRSHNTATGDPACFAIRAKSLTNTTGQRFEVLLYPTPSANMTLYYRYRILPDALASARISQTMTVGATPYTALTGAGSFTTAAVVAGDYVILTGSTGPTPGIYYVATKDSATQLTVTVGADAEGAMTGAVYPATTYPYGASPMYVRALLESCLQQAEADVFDQAKGQHYEAYHEALLAAIAADEELMPMNLGYNADGPLPRQERYGSSLTYNGDLMWSI